MKTLIIAGVQESKGRSMSWEYLEKLDAFLRDKAYCFDNILVISEPEITYPNYKLLNIKEANKQTLLQIVDSLKGTRIPTFLRYYMTHDPLFEIFSRSLYDRMKELGVLHPSDFITLSDKGNTELYYSLAFKELVDKVRTSNQIYLLGGTKEISLLQDLFKYHHKSTFITEELCFDSTKTVSKDMNIISSEPSQEVKNSLSSYLDKSIFSKLEID